MNAPVNRLQNYAPIGNGREQASPTPGGWSLTDEIRRSVMMRQWLISINGNTKDSDSTAAARCLIAMDAQALKARKETPGSAVDFAANDNVLINSTPEERRERLAAIAERLGARRLAGGTASRRSTADPELASDAQMPNREGGGEPS
jgi:hypothetical protein